MSITQDLNQELSQLVGHSSSHPTPIVVSGADQIDVRLEVLTVDSLSCSVWQIALSVPALAGCGLDTLQEWSDALCQRVTYLLENIGTIEADQTPPQVLIRSTPPAKQPTATRYYEVLLQSQSTGVFTLRRFEFETGKPGRIQVKLDLTHEVLLKLVDDLLDTIPAVP